MCLMNESTTTAQIPENNTLLVWDLENISIKYIQQIYITLGSLPRDCIVSTQRNLNVFEKAFIENFHLHYIQATEEYIADKILIDYAKEHIEKYNKFIFLTGDSDFLPIIKTILGHKKRVAIFSICSANYRLLMNLKFATDPKLTFYSLDPIHIPRIEQLQRIYNKQIEATKDQQPLNSNKNNFIKLEPMLLFIKKQIQFIKQYFSVYIGQIKNYFKKQQVDSSCSQCTVCKKHFKNHSQSTLKIQTFGMCQDCKSRFYTLVPPNNRNDKTFKTFQLEQHQDNSMILFILPSTKQRRKIAKYIRTLGYKLQNFLTSNPTLNQSQIQQQSKTIVKNVQSCSCCNEAFATYTKERTFSHACMRCRLAFFGIFQEEMHTEEMYEVFVSKIKSGELTLDKPLKKEKKHNFYTNSDSPFAVLKKLA